MSQRSYGAVRVLAVFPMAEDRKTLCNLFCDLQWKAQFVESFGDVEEAFQEFRPDVVMTDTVLPAGEGWKDVLRSAQTRLGNLPVIVSSRLADERLWAEVLNLGGYDLLVKPFIAAEVKSVVYMACRTSSDQIARAEAYPLVKHA